MTEERWVGEEARKTLVLRSQNGFIRTYLSGANILDIGYKGYIEDVVPIVPQAIGVELDYPGYDGRTLPFDDGSQDAVFSSHCLEHIPDFCQALRDWHRVLRVGGFMVIIVPHQFLYEKRISLPSHFNADHQRFYTPASLAADIEASLLPNSYRVRHLADNDLDFDYTIPPERHSGGCYEIEMVIEKLSSPSWALASENTKPPAHRSDPGSLQITPAGSIAKLEVRADHRISVFPATPWDLALFDFGFQQPARRRILVLHLGHLGDFIIAAPALRKLRNAFPKDFICLVVGSWNRASAESSGLADEILTHDHFPEVARAWDGKPVQDAATFKRTVAGHFDVAIDVRVDEDTRHLLEFVDADTRCGIGISERFPFLDIFLPFDQTKRPTDSTDRILDVLLGPERFQSRLPVKGLFKHETDFAERDHYAIYGPYLRLPAGRFRAFFALDLKSLPFPRRKPYVRVEVTQGVSNVLAKCDFSTNTFGDGVHLDFDNTHTETTFEFRVYIGGNPIRAKLGFSGVRISQLEGAPAPRLHRSDLHIGEQQSLLVQLAADRLGSLYPPPPQLGAAAALPAGLHVPSSRYRIVIAPVSNSAVRDWPVDYYIALVKNLVERFDCTVLLIGSRPQSSTLAHIVQATEAGGHRVLNLAGRLAWPDVPALLHTADLVICNNSGIAHLSASLGTRTLSIYSASHQPQEWGPRGEHSKSMMAILPCSPCGHEQLADCPFEHACMTGLLPDSVFEQAAKWLQEI